MTAIEYITEQLIINKCPADVGLETECSEKCKYDNRDKDEFIRCSQCRKCWTESEIVKR